MPWWKQQSSNFVSEREPLLPVVQRLPADPYIVTISADPLQLPPLPLILRIEDFCSSSIEVIERQVSRPLAHIYNLITDYDYYLLEGNSRQVIAVLIQIFQVWLTVTNWVLAVEFIPGANPHYISLAMAISVITFQLVRCIFHRLMGYQLPIWPYLQQMFSGIPAGMAVVQTFFLGRSLTTMPDEHDWQTMALIAALTAASCTLADHVARSVFDNVRKFAEALICLPRPPTKAAIRTRRFANPLSPEERQMLENYKGFFERVMQECHWTEIFFFILILLFVFKEYLPFKEAPPFNDESGTGHYTSAMILGGGASVMAFLASFIVYIVKFYVPRKMNAIADAEEQERIAAMMATRSEDNRRASSRASQSSRQGGSRTNSASRASHSSRQGGGRNSAPGSRSASQSPPPIRGASRTGRSRHNKHAVQPEQQ